jgi:hypothetical protein
VVARAGRELLERERVLREARAAEADAGAEEAGADPAVEADALRDLDDVGAGRLAEKGTGPIANPSLLETC